MDYLFKIGEVAGLFEISVRALRLYDKSGLFSPEHRDEHTGYRYYTESQLNKLSTIVGLRKVGFSLDEISQMFDPQMTYVEIIRRFQLKKASIQKQLDTLNFSNELIDSMIETAELTHHAPHMDTLAPSEYESVLSKVACLENIKFENLFMQILWL